MSSSTYDISGEWVDTLNDRGADAAEEMDGLERVEITVSDPTDTGDMPAPGVIEAVQLQVVGESISIYVHPDETDGPTWLPAGEVVKFQALGMEWLGELDQLHFEAPGLLIDVSPIAGREATNE